jgi:fatty-acyl-CoA synthase
MIVTHNAKSQHMTLTSSYYAADARLALSNSTVGELLAAAAADTPDRSLVVCDAADRSSTNRLTYADALARARAVARVLSSRYERHEKIAIWSPNSPEWMILEYGAALAGITFVTVNPALRPAELRHVLGDSRAVALFTVREYRGNDLPSFVAQIRDQLPNLREVNLMEDLEKLTFEADCLPPFEQVAVDPTSPLMILYTSGTTGVPKGVVLTHFGCVNNAALAITRYGDGEHPRWLCVLPMFHVGGSIINAIGALHAKATVVMMRQFDTEHAMDLIERESVTFCAAVPTMVLGMLDAHKRRPRNISSLTRIMSGGAPVPTDMVHLIENGLGVSFGAMYGLTETSGMVSESLISDTAEDKASTAGPPIPQTEVKICDVATGDVVPIGTIGSVKVRSFGVMRGYFGLDDATAQAIEDGWLTTGDLGAMDERGYIRITGRLKELIIRGGENIYPAEIENAIRTHQAVHDVAVVGVPDERMGEQVAAFVQLTAGCKSTIDELSEFARRSLAPHKVPRVWRFVDEFPLTPSGKIQKHRLVSTLTS